MGSTIPIFSAVDDCARAFLSLATSLGNPTRFAEQIAIEAILDEFDRFKLWAGNIAAHRKGRRSLENRLRDADRLKEETHDLLVLLSNALKKALAIVEGKRVPWDEETYSDSESEHSDDDTSNPDLQGNTELKQLYASIKTAITSLMRISMAIREPAPNSQSRSIDKSHFEQHDIQHVQNKFPTAPRYLTERLGHAISSRRQYLTYRETHHEKLTKDIDKLGLEAARTEFTANSTEATRLERTGGLNVLDGNDNDDTTSQTSYATSIDATVRAPKLPKEAREKEHYDCPFCFALVAIHTTAAWKRHVYQDLHPYCCTFENCTTADRLYDSRHAWFAHELEAHHSSFQCVQGCSKVFQTESEFENHVKSKHEDLAAPAIYSALRRASAKTPGLTEEASCRLCDRRMALRAMQKHLGHHHEQLALFALPANLDDNEDDQDEEDQDFMLRTEEGREEDEEEEELTDTSDTSENKELVQEIYVRHEESTLPEHHGRPPQETNLEHLEEWQAEAGTPTDMYEYEHNEDHDVERTKNAREELFLQTSIKEEKQKQINEEDYNGFLFRQRQRAEEERLRYSTESELEEELRESKDDIEVLRSMQRRRVKARRERLRFETENSELEKEEQKEKEDSEKTRWQTQDRELKETMRKRLEEFGFQGDQIETMIQPEQAAIREKGKAAMSIDDEPFLTTPLLTYAKISRDILDIETLHYYDIPYKYDDDPRYIVLSRETTQGELEILYEHTRRLRSTSWKRSSIDTEGDGNHKPGKSGSEVERSERQQPQSGDLVYLSVIQNGARVKGSYTVQRTSYNPGGWVEYSLIDSRTGQPYRHGALVREKELRRAA